MIGMARFGHVTLSWSLSLGLEIQDSGDSSGSLIAKPRDPGDDRGSAAIRLRADIHIPYFLD